MERDKLLSHDSKTILSPSSSGRRSSVSSHSSSTEFEFWMVQNPSDPQPDLLSADELFVNGVLLPLDLLPMKEPDPTPPHDPDPARVDPSASACCPDPEPSPVAAEAVATSTASKRWRDIFKKDNGGIGITKKVDDREKKNEKKSQSQRGTSTAELNINIWPFSRSKSAGNGGTRPKMGSGAPTRKVNSAPCSRSNSAGESKSRVKWPSSPGRAGVHLGRSSPVWQIKRGAGSGGKHPEAVARSGERGGGKKEVTEARRGKIINGGGVGVGSGNKARVLNLNVPMCVGYRHHLSCRGDETGAVVAADDGRGGDPKADVRSSGNLFGLRNLFSKKVY